MPASEWKPRFEGVAAEVRAACETDLAPTELRLDDRARPMWAEEDDPQVVPNWQIGEFLSFRLRERRTHHLFGRRWLPIRFWRTILEFGAEDLWDSPRWTADRGVWCVVHDERIEASARTIMERFCDIYRLDLDFSGTRKDP